MNLIEYLYKPVMLFPELVGHKTLEAIIKIHKHFLMNCFTLHIYLYIYLYMLFYIYVYSCRVAQNMTDAKPKYILILFHFSTEFSFSTLFLII